MRGAVCASMISSFISQMGLYDMVLSTRGVYMDWRTIKQHKIIIFIALGKKILPSLSMAPSTSCKSSCDRWISTDFSAKSNSSASIVPPPLLSKRSNTSLNAGGKINEQGKPKLDSFTQKENVHHVQKSWSNLPGSPGPQNQQPIPDF